MPELLEHAGIKQDIQDPGGKFMAIFQPMECFHGEKGRKKECDCEFKSSVVIRRSDRVWLMVADGLSLGMAQLQKHSCVAGNPARVQLECMITKNTGEVAKTLINEGTAFPSCPLMKVLVISF